MRLISLWLARRTWWGLLWLMRRRWMVRAQVFPARFLSGDHRATFLRRHYAQNRFARRIGLTLLVVAYEALLASAILSAMYQGALRLIEGGYIAPESLRSRVAPQDGEGG